MGCIISHCRYQDEYNEQLLKNKYCFQCSRMLTQKEYDKHIKKCTKIYRNRLNR